MENQTNGTKLHSALANASCWHCKSLCPSDGHFIFLIDCCSTHLAKYSSPTWASHPQLCGSRQTFHTLPLLVASTGRPRTSHQLYFFFFCLLFITSPVLLSLRYPFSLHISCFNSSFHHPSIRLNKPPTPPSCVTPLASLSEIPSPFNLHTEVALRRASEKKSEVMWEERKGNFPSTCSTPPAFFEAQASLAILCLQPPPALV